MKTVSEIGNIVPKQVYFSHVWIYPENLSEMWSAVAHPQTHRGDAYVLSIVRYKIRFWLQDR